MDISRIGLFVGLISFILAIPLAVGANLLTPRVQLWWNATTERRRLDRLEVIRKQLKRSENQALFNEVHWAIIREIRGLYAGLVLGIHGLLALCLLVIIYSYSAPFRELGTRRGSVIIAMTTDFGVFLFFIRMARRTREYWREHTIEGRASLLEEATKLANANLLATTGGERGK
jgi:hypothetical protein